MPGTGGTPANASQVGRANAPGQSSVPRVSVSDAGRYLDLRDERQVGQNELIKAKGFDDFMTTLLKVGGDVSNRFQYKVEERRAGELINNDAAREIIKSGRGPANGLLWSFRDEIADTVINNVATEVGRDAAEKFSANYLADADLQNQDWLLTAKPEDLVKKFASLEDPEAAQQLRNLTVTSPRGTAGVVASYQGLIGQARTEVRARTIEKRLENNAVIIGKELDNDITSRLEGKETLIQSEKDGFGGEVEAWTVTNVDEVAPRLKARAETLGVPVSLLLQRNVEQTISRINALAATAAEQIQQGQDPAQTLEDMQKEWQRANFYRALADSPALKTNAEDASVFTIRNPKTGKTLDDEFTETRKAYFLQVEALQGRIGEQMAAQASVEVALDPVQSSDSVNAVVGPLLARAKAMNDWKTMNAIIKATREPMSWKMQMDDRQEDAIGRQAVYDVKALISQGREPTEEDRDKILALGPAGLPALDVYLGDKERRAAKQDAAIAQQEAVASKAANDETNKWFPDASRIAGAAVDLKGMIAEGKANGTISQTAVVLDDAGLQATVKQRVGAILLVKMQEELQRTGASEVTAARAEVIAKEALDEAVNLSLSSLPPPPKLPPGAKPPERGAIFAIEEAAFDAQIRGNGGRPTILAIPKRIREQVLKQNPKATFTDMMAVWNKESAGITVPGPDGKPIFTKDIGTQRQQRLREIQEEKKKDGTFKPSIQVPYIGDPFKASRQSVQDDMGRKLVQGWSMFGLTPAEVTPPDAPLNSVMPQSETVTVTAPAPGKPAAKPAAAPDNSGIPPAALPKVEAGMLKIAGVDPAKTAGVAKPLLNNDPDSLAFAGKLATNQVKMQADSPPLPQAAPELEAVRISPNARSKDSPWVYAVLATSYKATARGTGGNITLPDWQFERKPGSLGLEGQEPSGESFIPNASGQYIATGTVRGLRGMSADGQTQTLHGLKGREGYDAKHGVGNDHVHHQGPNGAITLELAKYLQKRGFPITEFKGLNQRVGGHSEYGGHYDGTAFDVPVGVERHGEVLKAINDFYIQKGRRGEGIQRAGGWASHPLIKELGRRESFGGAYDAVNTGGSAGGTVAYGSDRDPSIMKKTIGQLINGKYHAHGKYQFITETLKDVVQRIKPPGITMNTVFTPAVQDQLFLAYLKDTGRNPSRIAARWVGLRNTDPGKLQSMVDDFFSRYM